VQIHLKMESREKSATQYFATTFFGFQHFDRTHTRKETETRICARGVTWLLAETVLTRDRRGGSNRWGAAQKEGHLRDLCQRVQRRSDSI